jgi:hypothetical protein
MLKNKNIYIGDAKILWQMGIKIGFCISFLLFTANVFGQGVGINTTDPQQALHMAGPTGTLRVESLNSTNNIYNGGDANADGDPTNDTYPLYVDENGEFTLENKTLLNTEDLDALNDLMLPTSTVTLLGSDTDGEASTTIITYPITVTRASILEVRYSLSYDVYLNSDKDPCADNFTRRISSHFSVNSGTRKYGSVSTAYVNGSSDGVSGPFYNVFTTYLTLPVGTSDISLIGTVSSDIKSGGGNTTDSDPTYVEFATYSDFILFKLH